MPPTALIAALLIAQAAPPPATEVYLAPLAIQGGRVEIGKPINISNSPGYDNQPSFTPDGASLLFTSVRAERKPDPANGAAIGSDIYRYDIASKTISQVTNSPESEYSPTVTPDGRHISVIRVESDGTQRLWQFTLDGREPTVLWPAIKPVGYHAWADASVLALFVLGEEGRPATLQVADSKTGQSSIAATGIGRSIQRIPGGGISFVSRPPAKAGEPVTLTVTELDPMTRKTRALVTMPPGATDADTAWTPDGLLLASVKGQIFQWRRGDKEMTLSVDPASMGIKGVTRLAISPKGEWIAVVAQP
jgi:dipeptidyl aminopeptidase/acylaminoacyl peptidase